MNFSIIIPTYNGENFIAQAINSVLNQSRHADEVIISDDNSTDKTLNICNQYSDKIKIFTNPHGPSGFVNGWKNAIAHASGEFICILHQDDLLHPSFLEEIEKAISDNPDAKHFFTPCLSIDKNGGLIRKPSFPLDGSIRRYTGAQYAEQYELTDGHLHRCPGVVTHKDIFNVCNYREEAGHIADDDFFLRVGNYTDVVGVMKPLAYYREHPASETGHLPMLKLNKRLYLDYVFQLSHVSENPMISEPIIHFFKSWQSKLLHRMMVFGLKKGELSYFFFALSKWLSFDKRFGNIRFDLNL